MNEGDTVTPRSLISAIFKHNEPQKTIRRSARRTVHRNSYLRRYNKEKASDDAKHDSLDSIKSASGGSEQLKIRAQPATTQSKERLPAEALTETTKLASESMFEDEFSLSKSTPRGLINSILQKHKITKTLRVAVRNIHPEIIKKTLPSHPSEDISEGNVDGTKRVTDIEEVSLAISESSTIQGRKRKEEEAAINRTTVRSEDAQAVDEFRKYKPKPKRLRLSSLEYLKMTTVPDDSFSTKVLSDLRSLMKNKQIPEDVAKKKTNVSVGVQTSQSSPKDLSLGSRYDNVRKSLSPVIEVHISIEDPEKSSAEGQDLVPPSDVDVDSQLGPLELSTLVNEVNPAGLTSVEVHESQIDVSEQKKVITPEKEFQRRNGSTVKPNSSSQNYNHGSIDKNYGHHEKDDKDRWSDSTSNTESPVIAKVRHSVQQWSPSTGQKYRRGDSDIWPDSINQTESPVIVNISGHMQQEIPDTEQENQQDIDVLPLSNPEDNETNQLLEDTLGQVHYAEDEKNMNESFHQMGFNSDVSGRHKQESSYAKKAKTPVVKISTLKKARKKSRLENNLPLTTNHITKLVRHYARNRFTSHALVAVQELSHRYLAAAAKDIEQACRTSQSRTITLDAVETFMKKKGVTSAKKTLNVLIEENFPLEYRQLLIPVAISGNSIQRK